MKVLIVSNSFFPEVSPRSFRATELAKEMARQGHEVKVITPYAKEQQDISNEYGIIFKDLEKPQWKPIQIKGTGVIKLGYRFLSRMLLWFFEYPMVELVGMVKRALKNESGYDLLISIAVPYPVHWGVARARKRKGDIAKVWVADCGDPYMGQENDSFKPMFYFGYVEKWFCRRADYLSVPTDGAIQAYYPEFHDKIKVIPQGFRFEDIQVLPHHGDSNKIIFGYGGMFIPGRRDPSEFLNFLLENQSVNYEFHIYTITPQFVLEFAKKSNGKIKVFEPIKRDKLLAFLSSMDFVVNFENVGSKQTPSKLIDYAIINKPILSIKTGELNTEAVNQFLNKNYELSLKVEDAEKYKIENIVTRFLVLN
jgi:hypothetical protein